MIQRCLEILTDTIVLMKKKENVLELRMKKKIATLPFNGSMQEEIQDFKMLKYTRRKGVYP